MIKKTLSRVDRLAARALPISYAGVLYDLVNLPDTVWQIEPFRVGAGFYAPCSAYAVERRQQTHSLKRLAADRKPEILSPAPEPAWWRRVLIKRENHCMKYDFVVTFLYVGAV